MICKHKRKVFAQITLCEGIKVANRDDITGTAEKDVYYCRDCRVLFVPLDSERVVDLHTKQVRL